VRRCSAHATNLGELLGYPAGRRTQTLRTVDARAVPLDADGINSAATQSDCLFDWQPLRRWNISESAGGRFSSLSYQFVERNGQQGLLVKTEEQGYGSPIVRPLILVDGSDLKNVTFNLGARVTWLDVGGYNTGELRVGYEGGWQDFERQVGNPNELPSFSGGYGVSKLQYKLDRLDDPVIPRAGQSFQGDFLWYNASPAAPKPYPVLEAAGQVFFKLNEPSSVFLNGLAGTTFNYATGIPQFSLGGSRFLTAYGTNELLMDKYFLFQLGYIRQLAKLPPLLGSGVYFLGVYEAAQVYGPPNTMVNKASGFPTDGAAGIVVNTIFGPVEAAYAYGDTRHHKFFFRIGRLF
jgi:hypothetical protein